MEVARRSGRVAKLRIFDQVQASRLVRFDRYGRYLGNGLAVIDYGSQVDHIHDGYKAGDDWCREMFIDLVFAAVAGLRASGRVDQKLRKRPALWTYTPNPIRC